MKDELPDRSVEFVAIRAHLGLCDPSLAAELRKDVGFQDEASIPGSLALLQNCVTRGSQVRDYALLLE
jgi:hypothetical protein